jgi:DNA-binding transcriptional ArsR family regulator
MLTGPPPKFHGTRDILRLMPDSVSADSLHLLRLILDARFIRELSVAEQRYQAVMAVIADGLSVSQVAEKVGVSRQTLHAWLARYEAEGLEGLKDRWHRPVRCPHQMPGLLLPPALFAYLQHELNRVWAVEGEPLDPWPADTSTEANRSIGTLPWLKAERRNN